MFNLMKGVAAQVDRSGKGEHRAGYQQLPDGQPEAKHRQR